MPHPRLIAGAMSGTSGDGVDIAIVRIAGTGLDMCATLARHHHVPFDANLRASLFAIRDAQQLHLRDLAKLGRNITLTYARATNEALAASNLHASDLSAVAAHGQTLFHEPPDTIQWFDPALLAAEVGCPVVSDFRRADCAAGGQGAPLVPFADYILFRHPEKSRAIVNIGGIANVTLLPAGCAIDQVIAYDTGPGNCISDYLVRLHDPTGPGVDVDGALATTGAVHRGLMNELMHCSYFSLFGPKSTDGPAMVRAFQDALARVPAPISPRDQLATACHLTVMQIISALTDAKPIPRELVVSGGGTRNRAIMRHLRDTMPGDVTLTDEIGVPSDAKEALAFALLSAATLDGIPSNIPSVTGAKRPVVLGSITPKP